jgi:hypothetical protein
MTLDEAVTATQARLGERVRMRTEVKGHKSRTHKGVREPGGFGVMEATIETTSARQLRRGPSAASR